LLFSDKVFDIGILFWHSAESPFCQLSPTCSTAFPARHLQPLSPFFIRNPSISADCIKCLLEI